jgi:nudix-type nucleoside diphosphatase (YffH/AdpP family)
MASNPPRIVARRPVFKGWSTFDVVTVEATDAEGMAYRIDRELIDHGEASAVLIVERQRSVAILVRQWRAGLIAAGVDPFLLEVCAGLIDPGETPEQAAKREAEEETGVKIGSMRKIGVVAPSAGTLTERIHLFIAEVSSARVADTWAGHDDGEHIEVVELPLAELFEMVRRGEIVDAKTLILVQHAMLETAGARSPG